METVYHFFASTLAKHRHKIIPLPSAHTVCAQNHQIKSLQPPSKNPPKPPCQPPNTPNPNKPNHIPLAQPPPPTSYNLTRALFIQTLKQFRISTALSSRPEAAGRSGETCSSASTSTISTSKGNLAIGPPTLEGARLQLCQNLPDRRPYLAAAEPGPERAFFARWGGQAGVQAKPKRPNCLLPNLHNPTRPTRSRRRPRRTQ
jgi:hypothetical protein